MRCDICDTVLDERESTLKDHFGRYLNTCEECLADECQDPEGYFEHESVVKIQHFDDEMPLDSDDIVW